MFLWKRYYSLVPITRYGSINQHTSFIWPCTFPKIWGVTINWINTQFWSTSRGTFDKNNLAPIAYTFVGVSINWIVTFSMPWGVTINWNMSSNWNQRVTALFLEKFVVSWNDTLMTSNLSVLRCRPMGSRDGNTPRPEVAATRIHRLSPDQKCERTFEFGKKNPSFQKLLK